MACPCSFNGQFLIGPNNLYWSWRAKINIYVHDFRMAKQLLVRRENWSVYQYWQSFRRVWTKIHFSSPFNQNPSDELYHLQSLMIYLSGFATQDPIDNTQNVFSTLDKRRREFCSSYWVDLCVKTKFTRMICIKFCNSRRVD